MKKYQTKFFLVLTFSLICLVRFWPFLLNKTLIFGDNYSLMVTGKIWTAYWLDRSVVPFWNPLIFSGLPWLSDINQSVFYPSTLLFMIFHPGIALNFTIIGQLLIAFLGMYLLAKFWLKNLDQRLSLLAGVMWMLSTQLTGSINNLSTIQSMAYLPLVIYLGLKIDQAKKWQLLFAIIIWLQLAGGYPQHVFYSVITAVIFSLRKNKINYHWWRNWIITGLLTVSLSAMIWLPFGEVLLHSTRMSQSNSQAGVGSVHPLMLISKPILSYFFDQPQIGMKWGPAWSGQPNMVFYLTWIGLVAITVSWWQKKSAYHYFYSIFTLATIMISLGSFLPGFDLLQTYFPFFRIARYPSIWLMVTNIVLILWAVESWQQIILTKKFFRWGVILLGGLLLVSSIQCLVIRFDFTSIYHLANQLTLGKLASSAFHTLSRDQVIAQVISQNLLIVVFLTILAWISWYYRRWSWLLVVVSLDLIYSTQGNFYFAPNKIYPSWSEVEKNYGQIFDQKINPQYRYLTRNGNIPYTDFGSYWEALVVRAPFSDSFVDQTELERFDHAINLRQGLTPDWNIVSGVPLVHGYTCLLPQDYETEFSPAVGGVETSINFIDYVPLDSTNLSKWSVKYYLVDSWFKVAEDLSQLKLIGNYGRWQLYQLPQALSRFRLEDQSAVSLIDFAENPNRLDLSFDNSTNQPNLIIADRFDHNWRALVNGREVKIENSDHQRKIALEPGFNQISLTFYPMSFYLGLTLSALGLLGWVVVPRSKIS